MSTQTAGTDAAWDAIQGAYDPQVHVSTDREQKPNPPVVESYTMFA